MQEAGTVFISAVGFMYRLNARCGGMYSSNPYTRSYIYIYILHFGVVDYFFRGKKMMKMMKMIVVCEKNGFCVFLTE